MGAYSLNKGRRKAVAKFTNRQGLMILGGVVGFFLLLILLWLLGYLPIDTD